MIILLLRYFIKIEILHSILCLLSTYFQMFNWTKVEFNNWKTMLWVCTHSYFKVSVVVNAIENSQSKLKLILSWWYIRL